MTVSLFPRQVALGADWLCFGDELGTELHHTQNYVLMPYQTYTGVAFHLLFASLQRMRPTFPQAETEVSFRVSGGQLGQDGRADGVRWKS